MGNKMPHATISSLLDTVKAFKKTPAERLESHLHPICIHDQLQRAK
jgi:hypothetical protein